MLRWSLEKLYLYCIGKHVNFKGARQFLHGRDWICFCVHSIIWHKEQETSVHILANTTLHCEGGFLGAP